MILKSQDSSEMRLIGRKMKKNKTRRYPRVLSENIISIRKLTGSDQGTTMLTSKVVGLGGIMFETKKRIKVGERLELTLLAGIEALKIIVRVVWAKEIKNNIRQVGVEFQNISEEERTKILDLLMRRVYLDEEVEK